MTEKRIFEMLANYREHAARVAFLEKEIPELEKLINDCKSSIVSDEVNITQVISDMPRGGMTSDPTGRLGAMLAEGFVPQRIREIEAELAEKKNEFSQKRITVVFVEAWLSGLSRRERFLVTAKDIDGETWTEIVDDYEREFEPKCEKTLRRKYDTAIDKIKQIAT